MITKHTKTLETRTQLTSPEATVIEFNKRINTYTVNEIFDFITKHIIPLEDFYIVTTVEVLPTKHHYHKHYPLYNYSLEKIIEDAQKDQTYEVSRFYFFKDSPDRMIHKDILANWKSVK